MNHEEIITLFDLVEGVGARLDSFTWFPVNGTKRYLLGICWPDGRVEVVEV